MAASSISSSETVRPATRDEEEALVAIGMASGLFTAGEADALLRTSLRGLFDGTADASTTAARVIDGPDGQPAGWTYISADPIGPPHVWELWWIGVDTQWLGRGYGKRLLADAEATARSGGAKLLLISTSSLDKTAPARALYERQGFLQVGRIPGYYADGDDKIIYCKTLPR